MKTIKLTFSGDIMLNSQMIEAGKIDSKHFCFDTIFSEIKEFLSQSDFVIGNLETPISKDNKEIKYEQYTFTSPIEFAKAVKNAGFDFVSTANNHCLDNGVSGIKKTINSLNEVGLKHTGITCGEEDFVIEKIDDIKIGILSYTYGTNAFANHVYLTKEDKKTVKVNLFQEQELNNCIIRKLYQSRNIIWRMLRKVFRKLRLFQFSKPVYERVERSSRCKKEIREKIQRFKACDVDYIIMCMHEGGQYNEEPLEKTKKTAEFLQKNGVDLIVGNHEHVIHKEERKEEKLIVYSLGNFVSTAGVLEEPFDKMAEYSILLNVYLSKGNGKVNVEKNTFTILKTILDQEKEGKSIKVKLLYDLIHECKDEQEKTKLMLDNQKIVKIFTNMNIELEDIQKEYAIVNV